MPLQFVEGLDPPKSSRQSPVLFGIVRRSLCGRVGGGGIGDGRCHHKYYVFPGGESQGTLSSDWRRQFRRRNGSPALVPLDVDVSTMLNEVVVDQR